jgi:anti-sigma factor RsiW
MDHNEAVRKQAAEKYVLGELPPALSDEYEEHFFDCAECALDLQAAAAFADTAREVLRQQELASEKFAPPVGRDGRVVPALSGWRRWLGPVLVPAFSVLLLLAGYQSFVSIPHWRGVAKQATARAERSAAQTAPHVLAEFSLLAANRRGGGHPVFQATPGKSFVLKVDIPGTDPSASASYVLRLDDATGAEHLLGTVSGEEARNTVLVEVPAGFPGGNAQLVVLEVSQPGATPREITRLPFVVAFGPEFEQHP